MGEERERLALRPRTEWPSPTVPSLPKPAWSAHDDILHVDVDGTQSAPGLWLTESELGPGRTERQPCCGGHQYMGVWVGRTGQGLMVGRLQGGQYQQSPGKSQCCGGNGIPPSSGHRRHYS